MKEYNFANKDNNVTKFEDVKAFREVKCVLKNGQKRYRIRMGYETWLSENYLAKVAETEEKKQTEDTP